MANDERMIQLLERMNKLLAVSLVKGLQLRDQVLSLDFAGFTPKEIADVVHKTPKHVSQILYEERKKLQKEAKAEESPSGADRGAQGNEPASPP
jgi:DNA-directed RNA polymerase specialized sigma24 family protein